ncbi:MAG: 3-deoxy-D-manno-octulosonic acid transferase [Candidatus Zapsychrus exili]|nr:3-deoxy-D-manno-octulosonic acid transferase [Candidatus Zapsychrus exili]
MFIIYDIISFLITICYLPYALIKGKLHKGFLLRFGFFSKELRKVLPKDNVIWVHAVSVGEVLVALRLIEEIKKTTQEYSIVCSTVTKTGNDLAKLKFGSSAVVVYSPIDFSWVVRKFIKIIKPVIYISTETEIWPNIYTALFKSNVPIVQINGRISDKAFGGYKKVSFITKKILKCVSSFCMQSEIDSERIISLGAQVKKVNIVGNIKFDVSFDSEDYSSSELSFSDDSDIIVAGSTHPGEEDIIINVYKKLIVDFPGLKLVIAPRHIERSDEVVEIVQSNGFKTVKFSEAKDLSTDNTVVVVDTIGHLKDIYKNAKLVFVGKSFKIGGGQNVIEPILFGKPTIVGPRTENFKDIVRILTTEGVLIQVQYVDELLFEMKDLLGNLDRIKDIELKSSRVIEKCRGATLKTANIILKILESK